MGLGVIPLRMHRIEIARGQMHRDDVALHAVPGGRFSVGSPQRVNAQAARWFAPLRLASSPRRLSFSSTYACRKFLVCRRASPADRCSCSTALKKASEVAPPEAE